MHPLTRELNRLFSLDAVPERRTPTARPHHFQVYTSAPGSAYRILPAYIGTDRAEADRIAARVGGKVEVCAGDP